jgi:hypothetical protein
MNGRLTSMKVIRVVLYSGFILSLGLVSCQKVINIDLNSASPQLVVEAVISDNPGPYMVKLSKSVSFNEISEIPSVSGAIVEVSDSAGISETLTEIHPGLYQASLIEGVPGHKYRLSIIYDGQTYEAVSVMPYQVPGISLFLMRVQVNEPSIGGNPADPPIQYTVAFRISDPAEYKNYYRFIAYHGSRMISSLRVFDDQYHNGKIIADDFILHDSIDFKHGDVVTVELQSIDKGTYDFFRTIRDGTGGLSFLSASPSNPISNISNNGLGYFSACSVTDRVLIIP